MKVIFLSLCLALTSFLLPQSAWAVSVARSAYDWTLDDADLPLEIPYTAGEGEHVEAQLVAMTFVEGNADTPVFSPLSNDIRTLFNLQLDERARVVRVVHEGPVERLRGVTLAVALTSRVSQGGGIAARQGALVPIFLHFSDEAPHFTLRSFHLPFLQWGVLRASVQLRNDGGSVMVPDGTIRATNLLSGREVAVALNPGLRRLPGDSTRDFSFEAPLSGGFWRLTVATEGERMARITLLLTPVLLYVGLGFLVILAIALLRFWHGTSART